MGGGIGGTISDIMGGQDEYYQATPKTDLGKYGYDDTRGQYNWMNAGDQAQNRTGPQMNMTNAMQSRDLGMGARGSQADALGMMQGAAMGTAPSVAQQQLAMGRDQSIQNAMAMAASTRGGGANLAASQMAAQRQAGETMGQVNQQAASLRANEIAQARQQYGSMASQQRAQDLQMQGLDANQAQAQAALEMQQRGLNDQYSMGMYGLGQHATDQSQMGGIRGQEDAAANQLGAGQINAGVAGINAGANSQGGSQALGAAAGIAGGMMMMSDERLKRDVRPIGGDMGGPPESAAVRQARLNRVMGQMGGGGNDAYSRGLAMGSQLGGALGSAFAPRAGDEPQQPLNSGQNMGTANHPVYDISANAANLVPAVSEGTKVNSVMGGAQPMPQQMGGGYAVDHLVGDPNAVNGAMLMSDARLKQGVGGAGGNAVDHFLGSLQPVEYHYKPGVPGEDPRQPRYGILAQDVAQSPMGRSVVQQTPIGMGINVPHATGALMAGEGELYARQRRLEAQMHAMRGGR